MDALFEAYLAAQRRRGRSPLTLKATEHALRTAQRWLDQQQLQARELTLLQCEQYFEQRLTACAVSSVRRQLAYLRAAYRYGLRHQLVAHDPTAEVKLPPLPDREPQTYSNEQLRRIHASIRSEREQLAFYLLAFAGLRLGETAALHWQQINLARAQIHLSGKAGKFRLVPLHPALHHVLDEHQPQTRPPDQLFRTIDGRPLAATTLGRTVRALVDRAEVEIDNPSHAFRRTVATVMYEQGARTRVIERIMGWSPRRMYERHYLRVADQAMHAAIATLYHDDPICDQQTQTLRSAATQEPKAEAGWLSAEVARLDQLEQRLVIRAD
jgi:integrase/recombinase XerD